MSGALRAFLARPAAALLAALALVALPVLLEWAAAPPAALRITTSAHGPTLDDERLAPAALPHRWSHDCAACSTLWYRLDSEMTELPREPLAIYLPAVRDNAAIYLNGRLLGQGGRFADPVARLASRPLWVSAPAVVWQPGANRLYVLVKAERARLGLMPAPAIGSEAALLPAWRLRQALAVTLPQLAATVAVVLALVLAVLAAYRRAEPAYRWFALAALLVGVEGFGVLVVEPLLEAPVWDAALLMLRAALLAACWRLLPTLAGTAGTGDGIALPLPGGQPPAGTDTDACVANASGTQRRRANGHGAWHSAWRGPWRGMAGLGAAAAAAMAAAGEPTGIGMATAEALLRLAFALAGLTLVLRGWRAGDAKQLGPGAALALAAAADAVRLAPAGPWPEALPLLPWALAALVFTAAWLLLVRFVQTLNAAELLNVDLEAMVRERTAALQAQFERVRELERREAIAAERERLMRDMHDGVGGHLVSMLAMIEADRRRPGELAQVVREALDDMRLMIDSLEPVDDDLNAVLAMFHDRLAPRLRAAGVALHWNVELLPQVHGLTPARVLHLLRMLQEAVTNALRHGRARTLWLSAAAGTSATAATAAATTAATPAATPADAAAGAAAGAADAGRVVRIELRDDGEGFDPEAVAGGGRGLKNLARRAGEIGAELAITSAPGQGARIVVQWALP